MDISTGRNAQDVIERIVDQFGLAYTVDLLAAVCYEKSDHVASNWQDFTLAKSWERNGRRIGSISLEATE